MSDDGYPGAGTPPVRKTPEKMFFGCILMAIGGMMALLCGTCAVVMAALTFSEAFQPRNLETAALPGLMGVVFGVVPAIIGVVVFRAGLIMFQGK